MHVLFINIIYMHLVNMYTLKTYTLTIFNIRLELTIINLVSLLINHSIILTHLPVLLMLNKT